MISERRKVFRFATEPHWNTLWLRRDESLFSNAEWSWVADSDEAWIFERAADAEAQAEEIKATLTKAEASHVHVFIFSGTAEQEQRERKAGRCRREDDRVAATERSVRELPPAEVYQETARRLGERD